MLTVIFATHNGARTLPVMLESLTGLKAPSGGWRVVAIDNGSTDDSRAIIASYASRLPITVLDEPTRGKNRALNAGLSHLAGDLVVFTDDDVTPRTDWLVRMRAVADEHPQFDVFGGRITPVWPLAPPDWILRLVPLGVAYAASPPGLEDGPVSPLMVWGANMALRRRVFDLGHVFNEAIGPRAGQYRMGGETELTTRLEAEGHGSWCCADAVVGHLIRPEQLTVGWLLKRAFRFGRSQRATGPETERLGGEWRVTLNRLLAEYRRTIRARIAGDRDEAFRARWETQVLLGTIVETGCGFRSVARPRGPGARHGQA